MILVLNSGSSSLKYSLWDGVKDVAKGTIDRVDSMETALAEVFRTLGSVVVEAVGHRVVHGGGRFADAVLIDDEVERAIDELGAIAPLHNPYALEGIRAARGRFPGVPQVAVFDTAFHHTLPPRAYTYAVPDDLGIRRYGFHGISHHYVSERFAELAARSASELRVITCHLGNGCSMCAVEYGRSIDTSMGFTPMEGLVMGTRCGDIDAGAVLHLLETKQTQPYELRKVLNSGSGLLGMSGISNDMREILDAAGAGNRRASAAVDVFCYRAKKYIGSYMAAMNGADAVVFTGGIGENSPEVRAGICKDLDALGILLDHDANFADDTGDRQIGFGSVAVWVVHTREDLLIAKLCSGLTKTATPAA